MEPSEALKDIRRSLHDLAQPLATVTGIVDLMLLEQSGDSPLYEDINLINERLDKILEIAHAYPGHNQGRDLEAGVPVQAGAAPRYGEVT